MANSNPEKNDDKNLLSVLVEKSLLSKAQADLVESDAGSTGMPIDEILIARGWVDESVLNELKPSTEEAVQPPKSIEAKDLSYDDNLKKYRSILGEILGESSE